MIDLPKFLSSLTPEALVRWDRLLDEGYTEIAAYAALQPFPETLQPYRALIESTIEPAVYFSRTARPTKLHESKLGGTPYFPYDQPAHWMTGQTVFSPWPKNPDTGSELLLLAQLNFEELPLAALPSFPSSGILQLFVEESDWHHLERNLHAIYHPQIVHEAELLYEFPDSLSKRHSRLTETALRCLIDLDYMTLSDFRLCDTYSTEHETGQPLFEALTGQGWKDYLAITSHREFSHHKGTHNHLSACKIGGYHHTQNFRDPRAEKPEWKDSVLLLQLGDYKELSWGDAGFAQFFIKRADLENLDFSDIIFHWDST